LKLLIVINVDWFFISHRLPVAVAAIQAGHEVHLATLLTQPTRELESYGLHVHPLTSQRNTISLTSLVGSFIEMYRLFKKVRPDIVHLVTIKPVLLGGIAARLARVPCVVAAISGLGFLFTSERPLSRFYRMGAYILYRIALGHRNLKIIVQNQDDQETVRRLSRQQLERFRLLPGSGVDLQLFRHIPELEGDRVVLFAGRMLKDKGLEEFVEAAKLLRPFQPCTRFVLAGSSDPDNPASFTEVQLLAWHEEGLVEWWGPRIDMPEVLSQAHLVVLPSFYGEGLPKILIEAAACGRAIVTSNWPGCRDAIEPGVTGLLVPIRNPEALAEAINSLLNNALRRKAMGIAGRKRAECLFAVEKIVAAHLEIYQELMIVSKQHVPA
jgi:glycosyltransferase involved in cell wall biosynthesis